MLTKENTKLLSDLKELKKIKRELKNICNEVKTTYFYSYIYY